MNNDLDLRDAFSQSFTELARTNKNVMLLDCDMGLYGLKNFEKDFPDQFIQCGVMEQTTINLAAGLAMQGKFPFVLGIGSFLTSRAYEQLKVNIGGHNLPVTIVGVGPGMSFGYDGTTHHGIHDIGLMRTIPEFEIINPSDPDTIQEWILNPPLKPCPRYIRLDKGTAKHDYTKYFKKAVSGKIYGDSTSSDVIQIYTTGYMTHVALQVQNILRDQKKNCNVYEISLLSYLASFTQAEKRFFSIEEHDIVTGLGEILNVPAQNRFGFPHIQITEFGSREYFLEKYELTAEKIAEKIKETLQ